MSKSYSPPSRRAATELPYLLLPENHFAWHAVERLRTQPPPTLSRLVWLSGLSGMGKSHLARRFARELAIADPTLSIAHLDASSFAAELAEASDAETIPRFQQRFRDLDVFICEDLSALKGRYETQRQLLTVIDDVLESRGRVLLTARQLPGELREFLPRLINRFHAGVSASLVPLSGTSRASLISHMAQARQTVIPMDVCHYLGEELDVSPRELLATVEQLDRLSQQSRMPISLELARRHLQGEVKPQQPSLSQIARAASRHFDVTVAALRSAERSQALALPRQCAMTLARELTGESLESIARYFSRRNHSTVIHACERVRQLLKTEPTIGHHLVRIREAVTGRD